MNALSIGAIAVVTCMAEAFFARAAEAQPSPFPVEVRQPDGRLLSLRLRGSGKYNWYEDADAYAVVYVPISYRYAARDASGGLVRLPLMVGQIDPAQAGLRPGSRPSPDFLKAYAKRIAGEPTEAAKIDPNPPNDESGLSAPAKPVIVSRLSGGNMLLTPKSLNGFSWFEDEQGYTVLGDSGRYEYAVRGVDGGLLPSGVLAGSLPGEDTGIAPGLTPDAEFLRNVLQKSPE